MPIVNVKVIEDVFTPAQKQEMIQKLTDAMVSIEGETMRQVTWVYIEDVKQGEFGTVPTHERICADRCAKNLRITNLRSCRKRYRGLVRREKERPIGSLLGVRQ